MFKYFQKSGALLQYVKSPEGVWSWLPVGIGYAGSPEGVNDPSKEAIPNVGPIPCGIWAVSFPHDHPKLGPLAFRLTAMTYRGPRNSFYIHGDNSTPAPMDGSHGCIVVSRDIRQKLADSKAEYLIVEAE